MKTIISFWKNNRLFFFFVMLMCVFRSAVADWYTVPTGSMQPTIEVGDRITVNKMAYDIRLPFSDISLLQLDEPVRGDIVVFESEQASNRLIKRVIGLPGDQVSMRNNNLYVNGRSLNYQLEKRTEREVLLTEQLGENTHQIRLDTQVNTPLKNFSTVTVPEDYFLVLGDNRNNSADSRVIGFVPRHELRGKAGYVAFSLDYDDHYLPRKKRFLTNLYEQP
ncbi:signal peptidase I [Corallincola platygyrae]|uniref:Signal peptidase I n=1 Tax=Corallincola platygyrae TaxID=1193278 RepID=A0ABW4XN71_9GAMM